MFKRNVIALAVSGLSALTACSTVSIPERAAAPERAAIPERAGKIEPVISVRNSGGVDSEAMYRIGRYYQGQMRYDDAVGAYCRALAMDSRNVEARNALAVAYSLQGLALDAEREFRAAIAQSPGLSHLHGNLGYLYLQLGRVEEARAALQEAVRLDPANARALTRLAWAGGDLKAAVEAAAAAAVAPAATAPVAAIAEPAATAAVAPKASAMARIPADTLPALPVAAGTKAPATIAELVGSGPAASTADLVSLAPNVWELRPRVAPRPEHQAPKLLAGIAQTDRAIAPGAIPRLVRLEIANGNGATGLARRVGGYLRSLGMSAPRLTNQRPFDQRRTQIQYVSGMEYAARDLRFTLDTPADLVLTPKIERNAQMRVVLGRDFHEIEAVARMPWATKQIARAPVMIAR